MGLLSEASPWAFPSPATGRISRGDARGAAKSRRAWRGWAWSPATRSPARLRSRPAPCPIA